MLGAHSNELDVSAEFYEMFKNEFRGAVEGKAGKSYTEFEPVKFTKQVVAGMVFKIKYKVDDGKHILAKVFKPLPHTGDPAECMEFMDDQPEDAQLSSLPWDEYSFIRDDC